MRRRRATRNDIFLVTSLALVGLGLLMAARPSQFRTDPVATGTILGVGILWFGLSALESLFGKRCPSCRHLGLRVVRDGFPSTDSWWYYRCRRCRIRLNRASGGSWFPANSPADARRYDPPVESGGRIFAERAEVDASTPGFLLKLKRFGLLRDRSRPRSPTRRDRDRLAASAQETSADVEVFERLLERKRRLGASGDPAMERPRRSSMSR